MNLRRFLIPLLLALCALSARAQLQNPLPPLWSPGEPPRVIGYVAGRPVHADRVTGYTPQARASSLIGLIVNPALAAYFDRYRNEWATTPADIDHYLRVEQARVRCGAIEPMPLSPDQQRAFVRLMADRLKMQRFIHQHHGGGRVLFQQTGVEAYDATRRLVLDLERQGAFAFTDPELRQLALAYWLEDPAMGLMPDPGPQAFLPEQVLNPCPVR